MKPAIVWAVGGSDSSSGAGVQADILTIDAFSVHACSVIVALTAQNTLGVESIEPVSESMISAQMRALASDLPATAVKLGMLYGRQQIESIASALKNSQAKIVLDPVLAATSGDSLSQSDCARYLMSELLPLADLITPNLDESGRLLVAVKNGTPDFLSDASTKDDLVNIDLMIESMGQRFLECGAKAVLIKGGHRHSEFCQDFFTDGNVKFWLTSPRKYIGEIHGSGCAIASAIAAGLAEGLVLPDAIVRAKTYLNQCIRDSKALGSGALLLGKEKFDPREEDIPKLTPNAEEGRIKIELDLTRVPVRYLEQSAEAINDAASGGGRFGKTIGAYPIVDRAFWIKRLALCGIKTIQIRIKDLAGEELLAELKQAVSAARESSVDLYINDFWREALLLGASGVHLGQGDLESADLSTIRASGIALGISTHCWSEVARAIALDPSYLAVGPIFETSSKEMSFAPQGLDGFRKWRRMLSHKLVAIGGISISNAETLIAEGADGIAMISDISKSENPDARAREWVALFNSFH